MADITLAVTIVIDDKQSVGLILGYLRISLVSSYKCLIEGEYLPLI